MKNERTIENIKEMLGQEVAVSGWLEITQKRIDQFADCTLDRQWIHVDKEKASKGPFGRPVAHGFLTLSLLAYFFHEQHLWPESTKAIINCGLNKVRFLHPVTAGDHIRCRTTLSAFERKGNDNLLLTTSHIIEIRGGEKPACVAQMLSMYVTCRN